MSDTQLPVSDQVNPSDVSDFIKQSNPTAPEPFRHIQLDAPAEGAAPTPTEEEEPRIAIPRDTVHDDSKPTMMNMMNWMFQSNTLGTVVVTDLEKILYEKAVILNNKPFKLDITVPVASAKPVICISSYPVWVTDLLKVALRQDEDAGELKEGLADIVTWTQRYAMVCQLLAVDGVPFEYQWDFTLWRGKPLQEAATSLRAAARFMIEDMTDVRWTLLRTALQIFTTKKWLCDTNVANASFWEPASKN